MKHMDREKDHTQFYQSKCDFFRGFTAFSLVLICLVSICHLISDYQIFGRFPRETLIPRTLIVIPLLSYIYFQKKIKNYKVFTFTSYFVLNILVLGTTLAFAKLPQTATANAGYVILQAAFFIVGFCAPFYLAFCFQILLLGEIFLANAFIHFHDFSQNLSMEISLTLGILISQYALQKMYRIPFRTSQELEQITYKDALTGAGNRRSFYSKTEELIENRKRFSLAYIDVDKLKQCNDRFGHSAGDQYLTLVTQSLQEICTKDENLYRIGGDEFILLSEKFDANQMTEKIYYARKNMIDLYKKDFPYIWGFSYGCVDSDPGIYKTVSELLNMADHIMYQYKVMRYMGQKHGSLEYIVEGKEENIDKSGLDNRIFEVFANTSDNRYTYISNLRTDVTRWSSQALRDFDLPGEYIYNTRDVWGSFIHPDDLPAYLEDINAVFSGQKPFHDIEYRAKMKDGNYVRCTCEGCILRSNSENEPDLFAGTVTNHGIADYYDPITNCYNIYEFLSQLQRIKKKRKSVIIMIIGMNQFSDINNAFGYYFGDRALKEFVTQLQKLLTEEEDIYRLDGAKFSLILSVSREREIDSLFTMMQKIARDQIHIENNHIAMELSGAAIQMNKVSMNETTILTELLHIFSLAKNSKDGILHLYDQSKQRDLSKHMLLMDMLKDSIRKDCAGFFLLYQPQVDRQGKVVGVESLLRWKTNRGRVIPPADYITVLENDTSFYQLGLWILRKALQETKSFVLRIPDFMVSVNVSYSQIDNYNFRKDVLSILKEENFPAENLILELTEHCQTLNPKILQRHMNFFHQHGIRIAADDFGTGYSSYSLMKQLPFDHIKIDQTFIRDMIDHNVDQMIVFSMIEIAKYLDMKVCIEGVETEELFELIKELNPDYYQGYFFAKPLALQELEQMMDPIEE